MPRLLQIVDGYEFQCISILFPKLSWLCKYGDVLFFHWINHQLFGMMFLFFQVSEKPIQVILSQRHINVENPPVPCPSVRDHGRLHSILVAEYPKGSLYAIPNNEGKQWLHVFFVFFVSRIYIVYLHVPINIYQLIRS